MRKRIIQKLAFLLSVVMVVSLFANINWTVRAEDAGEQIAVTISGNGTLDYTFYEQNSETGQYSQCYAGGAGQIKYNDENKVISIPDTAVKMTLKAYPDQNWQSDSASGTKNNTTLSAVDNGIFGDDGITIDNFTVADGFSINLTFTQQQSGTNTPAGSVEFEIGNSENGKAYYSFTGAENSWTEIGNNGILDSNTCSGKETIYIKAEPNSEQSVDTTNGANYVDIAGNRTNFTADDLIGGTASFSYDANNAHKVHIQFTGSAPATNVGDIVIAVKNAKGASTAYYRIGDTGEFTKIEESSLTLSASGELQNVNQGAKIYFKADIDSSQVLDVNNQNWYRVGDAETQFDLTQLENGEAYFTYDSNNTYNVQVAFDGGNNGGTQQDVSFSCSSMNGNENERVNAVEVQKQGTSDWVAYSSGALNSLTEGDTFKVRIAIKEGFTLDKVSFDYESFDGNSRVGYFKENAQPDYDAIIAALLSTDGYEITFQPEADSKDANNNSTLQANSTCLNLQYQTAIAYEASVDINWFFQTKDGDNGYGVWTTDKNSGADVFVDSVGDSEVIFSFNNNNYGENGDPSKLGYGKENTGENKIQVSYVSAYTGKAGQTATVTPDTYDYFSAGGYATGTNQNKIHLDDYDGLIDEVYIDVNGDNTFEASEKLTAKDGTDPNIGSYRYYEETLDAAASYNILVRKHKSTRVSLKWSYTESGTDYYVDHGKIFIEKVVRGAETLYQAKTDGNGDLVLDEQGVPIATTNSLGRDYGVSSTAGEVFVECGDVVTIRLIPTYGFQIKEAKLNGCVPLTANEKVSSFTFTVEGNLHLAGNFDTGTDVTDTSDTKKINDAGIADGQNATDSGNLKLTVADHSGTYANASAALEKATEGSTNTGAEAIATLDMTLDSMVSKGNGQYWTDDITSFENDIKVNLELNDTTYVPGDTYVVVREHTNDLGQTELEKLTTTYSNGMLEVPTNKFSTYSIVKIPVAEEDRPNMYLGYDPRGEGEEAGSVTVKCDGAELTGTDGYYKYADPTKAITFELKRPADRVDTESQTYTPVVEVVFPQENDADTVVKNLSVTGDTFTVTPSTDSGLSGSPFMEVYVHWSAYDSVGPDDGQFMVILRKESAEDTFVFQNNPTVQRTVSLDGETKYIFANGTNVSVEIQPGENRELVEVYVDTSGQCTHYSAEPQEGDRDIAELKTSDRKFVVPNLAPGTFVEAICIELPVLTAIHLTDTSQTLYDTMKRSEVGISATCTLGGVELQGTVELDGENELLTVGENEYKVIFTSNPNEQGEQISAEGIITLKVLHEVDISGLGWIDTTFTYNGTAQGPSFTNDLPEEVQVASTRDDSQVNTGNYTAVASVTLANGYSNEFYKLVNPSSATGITITEGGAIATVTQAWSITQATPTITLSNLSETTQAPTGAKATLNPADASAQVVIEYLVLDTPAVAATPEVACNVTHAEGCASLAEGKTTTDCNCAKAHTSHNEECGYKAATSGSPATFKWGTTRPTTPGAYPLRVYLPTETANVAAIPVQNAVTGTYTLTQYTAPSDGGSNSGSDSSSDSDSDDDSDSSSGSTTTPAPATPTQAETTPPASTANTTTRRPVPATEESNTETASDKTIGVSSEEGAEGWTNIKTEINDKLANAVEAQGDEEVVVTVEMNGENTVPSDVFETIAGQDITVTFDMGNGIVWAVNGMDVTADSVEDINFSASTGEGVTAIPSELLTGLTEERFSMELTLEYEGEFGFTAVMSVNVDKKNAGKYANLFYFNPKTKTMEFICSAPVKEDGTTDLTFTHASDYIIVVDEVAMSVANNLSMDKVVQPVPQETPSELSPVELGAAEKDAFNPLWILVIGIVVLLIGGIAIVATKMKKE